MLVAFTSSEVLTLVVAVVGVTGTLLATVIGRRWEARSAAEARRETESIGLRSRVMDRRLEAYGDVMALYRGISRSDPADQMEARDAFLQAWSRAMLVGSPAVRAVLDRWWATESVQEADRLVAEFLDVASADLGIASPGPAPGTSSAASPAT